MTKNIFAFGVAVFFFSTVLPIAVAAQGAGARSAATVVADVNLTDVTFSLKGNSLQGQFALQGKMGQQNNIVFGIVVRDKNQAVVHVQKLGEEKSIQEGELRHYTFEYTIPALVRGEVSVILIVDTVDGLPLGSKELVRKTNQGTGRTFSCTSGTKSVTCSSTRATNLTASYVRGSIFADAVSAESKNVQKGEEVIFSPSLAAGAYYALITDTEHMQTLALPLSVAGNYGEIKNVVVTNKSGKVLDIVIVASALPSEGTTVSVQLIDKEGGTCGSGDTALAGSIAELSVPSACREGTVTATLLDAKKATLATSIASFFVPNGGEEVVTTTPKNKGADTAAQQAFTPREYLLSGALFVVLVLLTGIVFFFFRKKSFFAPLVVLLIAATSLISVHHAEAATVYIDASSGTCQYTSQIVLSSDKSSYNPGDMVNFTSTVDLLTASGTGGPCSPDSTATFIGMGTTGTGTFDVGSSAYAAGGGTQISGTPAPYLLSSGVPHSWSNTSPTTSNVQVPLSMSPGNHNFDTNVIAGLNDKDSTWWNTAYYPFTITVDPSSVPVINGSCASTHYNCSAGTSVNNIENTTTWTWDCIESGGGTSALGCSEAKSPAPIISSFYAGSSAIEYGQSTTLYWASNATSCTPVGGFTTAGLPSGSTSTGLLYSSQSYGIYCDSGGGRTYSYLPYLTVTVDQPSMKISAAPSRVKVGGSTVISWNSTGMTSCDVKKNSSETPSWTGLSNPGVSETITAQATYTLTCSVPGVVPFESMVVVNVVPTFQEI
jgi:hypothetical protein